MGYTIPGWLDEVLDFIGINFPNVDEDDYRDMADAMGEFAEKFEGHGGDAHAAFSRILSSSEGWAVDAMERHWSQVKTNHLEKLPELARLFADACDVLADIIFGMKTKAEVELGVMAASVGISAGLAVVTGGLSALIGAAEVTAMRQMVKRIIDEAVDRIIDEVLAKITEPINAKLEAMVEDVVLDLAEGAFSLPSAGGGQGAHSGHGGMQLASAGGSSGGGATGPVKNTKIDHFEFEDGAGKVSRRGGELHLAAGSPLSRAKGAFGRSKGRDPFTQAFDSVLHGALKGSEKALGKIAKHVSETVPDRVKATSRLHKDIDTDIRKKIKDVNDGRGDDHDGKRLLPDAPGLRKESSDIRFRRDSLDLAKNDSRRNAIPLTKKICKNDPIDVATGEMTLTHTDLSLPGTLPLVIRRTHLSAYAFGQWFGRSWASTPDERIELDPHGRGAVWAREDGSLLVYPQLPLPDGSVEVLPVEGPGLPLAYEGQDNGVTTYRITDPATGQSRFFAGSPYRSSPAYWLVRIEDRNDNGISFVRRGDGAPVQVVHDGGYQVALRVEEGRVVELSLQTPEGPVTVRRYGYDRGGNLDAITNSSGLPLRLAYDTGGRITSWTDRNDSTFQYVYDARGRVVRTTGPEGFLSSSFAYEEVAETNGRITRYTDSTGATTTFHINEAFQVVAETDPLGATTSFTYDAADRLLRRTDALGRSTTFERDEEGSLTGLVAPDGVRSTTTYNDMKLPEVITERGGARRRYLYDDRGNLIASVEPTGTQTEYGYTPHGHLILVRDALGATTRITTNAAGLPERITRPDGAIVTCVRDGFGRVTAVTDAMGGLVRQGWSVEGKPTWRELPDGSRDEWTWDGEGNLLSHTDRLGRTTNHSSGHFDKLLSSRTGEDSNYHFTTTPNCDCRRSATPRAGCGSTPTTLPAGSPPRQTSTAAS